MPIRILRHIMVGMTGLEPAASCSQSKRSSKLSYIPIWQGWQDSNLRMQQSKCCVLPLDDTPTKVRDISTASIPSRWAPLISPRRAWYSFKIPMFQQPLMISSDTVFIYSLRSGKHFPHFGHLYSRIPNSGNLCCWLWLQLK